MLAARCCSSCTILLIIRAGSAAMERRLLPYTPFFPFPPSSSLLSALFAFHGCPGSERGRHVFCWCIPRWNLKITLHVRYCVSFRIIIMRALWFVRAARHTGIRKELAVWFRTEPTKEVAIALAYRPIASHFQSRLSNANSGLDQWRRQRSKGARSFRGQKILQPGHPDALFPQKYF